MADTTLWRNPQFIKSTLRRAADALLPPRCPVTGSVVMESGQVAPAAWAALQFLGAPLCGTCGTPFAHGETDGMACGACMARPPHYRTARAALVYDDAAAAMILPFKHGDKTLLARAFAPWLARAGAEMLGQCDALVPVPLHRWRLLKRRYNQAALLAFAVGRQINKPVLPFTLQRKRATDSQGHKTRTQRADNVRNVFAVHNPNHIADKNIVLVDDVLTSGATVNECARVLLDHGAARVDVLTVARVVYGE